MAIISDVDPRRAALTLAIGAVGAVIALFAAFPAPYLLGPAIALTIASFAGLRLGVPMALRNVCFVVIGITMGTSVTPAVIEAARTWPASFLLLMPAIAVIFYGAYAVLERGFGYDRRTAMLAASPGHLSFIISLSADTKSDIAAISIIQSVRVLALTLMVPLIVQVFDLVSVAPPLLLADMPLAVLVAEILASVAVGMLFLRWRFPAALLLGGVAVSVSSHISGLVSGGVPAWLTIPVYVVLGCVIGTRFSGLSFFAMRRAFVAGAVTTLLVTLLAGLASWLVSWLTGVPLNAVLIAFAPGGLETMAAMAVMMHVDATYVGSHHVLRLLFLSVFMPLVVRDRKDKTS
ncbi:AbrB family transcriptional regulator [Rhizobium sp. YJ-22]|uniref:AbrB family transcriptional regulator n=1 Tax=Rhizobium sp. YJ-22 TaxID=3037556 RepID=UPI00241251C9|nr:AbrB family transcriptional regulator [Rhizobium sp. YJ-22]MDG3575141.1 AbrB family transcriptional regulator [Rhizobium sp. YJ-22]